MRRRRKKRERDIGKVGGGENRQRLITYKIFETCANMYSNRKNK